MDNEKLHKRINLVRRDLGNLLFHFTRSPGKLVEIEKEHSKSSLSDSPLSVLEKILSDGFLLGSSKNIRGGFKCICFTESPISEIVSLFSLVNIAESKTQKTRYEPFGIAVKKDWLYSQGGRPVLYQPENEFKLLPEELQYKHVKFEPEKGVDFTWEREWRIKADKLLLDPKETLVVVPDAETAFDLAYQNAEVELDFDRDPVPQGAYHVAKWMTVSLDLFGFNLLERDR
ncbi:hypothetical protein JWG42_14405 [Desulfoprunum benzoelyticum]|uniref:Uncharacterized protein n=1 Tax=Desulfoprunum benzoelyticum TaxID=1506996 RepID=A0A840UXA0_9BACT|nr:hypothetical protein [Desulfoprunum benzoelyticum]MBB5349553.1 hypothetical protein [Desulfoprunum benzoelyticum]MBM9531349.1 hypothetical protein [Desulfoprunum benzoelyticum]